MPADDQLVEVCGLLGGESVQAQIVQDEQVGAEEGPEGTVQRVVHSGLGQEGLADTGGTHQEDVFVPGQELQGEDGIQQSPVQGNGGGPVEVLQAAGFLEAGVVEAQFDAPVLPPADLISEDDLQE